MNEIDDFDTSTEKNVVEVELENCDVYIPLASNSSPGIASFDSKDFTVEAGTGRVKSKMKYGTPQYLGFVKESVDYNGTNALSWSLDSNSVKPIDKAEVGDIIMLTEVYDKFTPGSLFKIIAITDVVLTGLEVLGVLACNFDNYIVQETGNSEDKVMSQKAVTKELNEKVDKSSIVQDTGDSEDKVMSQKAATENFAHLIDGKVPASQLPSYVDDVLEYNTKSDFPKTGETGKIYVDKSTNLTYRWSGTAYIQVGGGLNLENGEGENSVQQKGTTASYDNMATFGKFNKNSPDSIFEIGCGTDTNNRLNVFEALKDGRAKVQSAPVDDDDVVRKKELTEKSFAYYSIEAETARDYSKGSKIDKMFKDILKKIETIENKLV